MARHYTAEEVANLISVLPSDQSDIDDGLSDTEPDERLEEVLENLKSENSDDSEEDKAITETSNSDHDTIDNSNEIARGGVTIWKKYSVKNVQGLAA